jgi:ribonuclease P protein component
MVLAKSPHFVLHHLAARPVSPGQWKKNAVSPELSTAEAPIAATSVDNALNPACRWLGLVVPKRHAKRAVTRSLLKREMRAAINLRGVELPPGQWLIRLRAPFDVRSFPSAASTQLRQAARAELDQVLAQAVKQ